MENKKYITPAIKVVRMNSENIMLTASPGVSDGEWDPTEPIDAKENGAFEEETDDDFPNHGSWGE